MQRLLPPLEEIVDVLDKIDPIYSDTGRIIFFAHNELMSNLGHNSAKRSAEEALSLAIKLKLITDDDAILASEVMARGIDLYSDWHQWLPQIESQAIALERRIKQSPYLRYLDGGPKPVSGNGRPDWAAKDTYEEMQIQLQELKAFWALVQSRLSDGKSARDIPLAIQSVSRLVEVHGALRETHVPSQVFAIVESPDDIRLCLAWSNASEPSDGHADTRYLRTLLGDYDACRLLSARLAEHAASHYYKSLGLSVEDVSVAQLRGNDDRWKDFDLLVNYQPVDVKNARRSFSSPDAYVQHCVPQFKDSRGTEVTIVGVLSDYLVLDSLVTSPSTCQILGEVTKSKLRKLYLWAGERFGDLLNLDGMWKPEYQPGWAYEYPAAHYRGRSKVIVKIPAVLEGFRQIGISGNRLPGWLISMCPERSISEAMVRPGLEAKVLADLHSLEDTAGISRPTLFIMVMGLFLEAIAKGEPSNTLNAILRRLLLVRRTADFRPLGLEDSQNYVANLIENLTQVHQETLRRNIIFKSFRMPHPSILRGQMDSGDWITLLAYCGGWRKYPMTARCGAAPLIFGAHEICPCCNHLICDACGFCSPACELVKRRQDQTTEKMREESGYPAEPFSGYH